MDIETTAEVTQDIDAIKNNIFYQAWGVPGIILQVIIIAAITWAVSEILVRITLKRLGKDAGRRVGGTIFANIIRILVWGVGICTILSECLGFDSASLIGAFGIVGIAISLGFQDTISNLIGGLQISLGKAIAVGDWISVNGGAPGKIVDINWRWTRIVDDEDNCFEIPNSVMNSNVIEKLTDWYQLPVHLSFKNDIQDVSAALAGLEKAAYDALGSSGWRYGDMMPKAAIMGSSLGAYDVTLKLYATRDAEGIDVLAKIMGPITCYLQDEGLLADLSCAAQLAAQPTKPDHA